MKPIYSRTKISFTEKNKENLTYGRAIVFGIVTELLLMVIQFVTLSIYYNRHPGTTHTFSTEYMMSQGFYVFLVPGFILFATIVFFVMVKYNITSVAYLFVFLLAAAVIEIAFYLTIDARYQGPFVYSVLDKVIGTGLGAIGYFAIGKPDEHEPIKS